MDHFANLPLQELLRPEGFDCACGRHHRTGLQHFALGNGVLTRLPEILRASNIRRPFVVSDSNTRPAAGEQVRTLLEAAGIPYTSFTYPPPAPCH